MLQLEEEIHRAVEAGVATQSGQLVWSLPNTVTFCFTLATRLGWGSLAPTSLQVDRLYLSAIHHGCRETN